MPGLVEGYNDQSPAGGGGKDLNKQNTYKTIVLKSRSL